MIKINYKDWYEVDLDDTHNFRKKDHSRWYCNDFTLLTKIKTDFDSLDKQPEESDACCVIGKPGMHFGLFVTTEGYFKFDFWTKENEESEAEYHSCFLPREIKQEDKFIDVAVSHNSKTKEVNLIVFQEHNENFLYTKKLYKDDFIDYSWSSTYIGCGFDDEKIGFPHNNWWAGDIEHLKVIDKFLSKDDLEDLYFFEYEDMKNVEDDSAYFKFDGEKSTYSSIFDLSNNNNHARFRKQYIMRYYNGLRGKERVKNGII